jgi:hypothetical protein
VQGQDANGDQRLGRDFRHQNAQRLEFTANWSRNVGNGPKDIVFAQVPKDLPGLGCKNWRNPQLLSRVKGIVALLTIAGSLTIAACSLFGPGEAVREEPGRTLYRAAEENPLDAPDVTPLREKVPGESR